MRLLTSARLAVVVLAAAALAGPSSAAAAGAAPAGAALPPANATYTTLAYPGALDTVATGVTRSGPLGRTLEVVGWYADGPPFEASAISHGFLYSGGQWTTLDVPYRNATNTRALGINRHGQIIGTFQARVPRNGSIAVYTCTFVYSAGTYRMLNYNPRPCGGNGLLGGYVAGSGINDAYVIAGTYDANGPSGGFTAKGNKLLEKDYYVDGEPILKINGLNNAAAPELVGSASTGQVLPIACGPIDLHGAWFPGGARGYGFDVPGQAAGTVFRGINDTGQIVGNYGELDGCGGFHGFVDDQGSYSELDDPDADALGTVAYGIDDPTGIVNRTYDVVGTFDVVPDEYEAGFLAVVQARPVIG